MVRTYKRKGNWQIVSPSRMQEALDAVASGESIRKASERFGISFETLRRHSKKIKLDPKYSCTSFSDACATRRVFTESEEQTLVEYLQKIARMGFPLKARTVRSLAYELAERNNKSCPSAWNERGLAGKDWMTSFLCRHKEALSLRTPEATSVTRAAAFNEQNVKAFFAKLKRCTKNTTSLLKKIYNADETGLTTSQKATRVVAEAGCKQVPQVVSHERGETVTLCAFVNSIGNTVPPCLIFPRKRFYDRMMTGAPPGTLGLSSPSGWMTTELFLECLRHFVKHVRCSKTERALLLLNNHESHVSIEATDFCRDNGIILLTFPPHCSHRLQPLDLLTT